MQEQTRTNTPQEQISSETGVDAKMILVLLCTAQFMVVLDASIMNVALPSIGQVFGLSPTGLSWVVTSYVLLFGGFLLLGGRMGDLFGRRRVLMTGLTFFTLASLGGGLAQPGWMLIGARALQGFAAALVAPSVLSLITTTFSEGSERNGSLSIYGAVTASGFAVGASFGGALTQLLSWRWVFFVNVPIGIATIVFASRLLPKSRNKTTNHLDLFGSIFVTVGLIALVYGITEANNFGWGAWQIISALAGGILLLLLFVLTELRSQAPLIRLSIFRQRMLTGGNLVGGIFFGATFPPLIFILTLYMQNILGYSPIKTGLVFLPLGLASMLATQGVPWLAGLGIRWCLAMGAGVMAAGYVLLSRGLSVEASNIWVMLIGMLLVGVGVGLMVVMGSIAATTSVSDEEQGLASGLLIASREIGVSLGIAIFVAVAAARREMLEGAVEVVAQVSGFRYALFVGLGFTLLAGLAAIFVIPKKKEV